MDIDVKWWSIITVLIISLLAVIIIDANSQVKSIDGCKSQRIRPFSQQFFTWNGIVDLNEKKLYQPSCL
ncbi:MAG: hypothetical protein WC069_04290 [Candidatus Shapirobacteria bacterium]